MTWKISESEHHILLLKMCNECGDVIQSYGATHPLTMHMVMDLGMTATSDFSKLDMGLQPYHWHTDNEHPYCLVPPPRLEILRQRELKHRLEQEQAKMNPKPMPNKIQHGEKEQEIFLKRNGMVFSEYKPSSRKRGNYKMKGRAPQQVKQDDDSKTDV